MRCPYGDKRKGRESLRGTARDGNAASGLVEGRLKHGCSLRRVALRNGFDVFRVVTT